VEAQAEGVSLLETYPLVRGARVLRCWQLEGGMRSCSLCFLGVQEAPEEVGSEETRTSTLTHICTRTHTLTRTHARAHAGRPRRAPPAPACAHV